ncbi:MAG: hypothetical protein ACTS1Z_11560 [Parasphingopyxis sp.]
MAEAAEAMNRLTAVQTRTQTFEAVVIWWAFLAAFAAAFYAWRAAQAAEGELDHARTVSAQVIRPYLAVEKVTFDLRDEPNESKFTACIKNFGQTAASDYRCHLHVKIVEKGEHLTLREKKSLSVDLLIAPASSHTISAWAVISADQKRQIKRRESHIQVKARFFYAAAGRRKQHTHRAVINADNIDEGVAARRDAQESDVEQDT